MSSTTPQAITDSSFCYDPAKTITRACMGSSFPTVTHWYARPYPTGDQIQERGKNLNAVTEGETYSNLWMDDLIYATTIHASNHLHANGNLDGYIMFVVLPVFGVDPSFLQDVERVVDEGIVRSGDPSQTVQSLDDLSNTLHHHRWHRIALLHQVLVGDH